MQSARMRVTHLQVGIVLVGQRHLLGDLHLLCVLIKKGLVDGSSRGSESGRSNEVLSELASLYYK